MELEERVARAYQRWYEGLEKGKSNSLPDWGPICTGLIILERLTADYTLDIEHHKTANGSQIRGQGLPLANRILAKFHVAMKLTSGEFGRTNRSSVPTAEKLLDALKPLHLEHLSKDERNQILTALQEKLLATLLTYSDHFQIEAQYEPAMSTEKFVRSVLAKATPKTSGAIAQHLVGAKLELRFPDIAISNHSASTADAPTERSGDFIIGDTVFHVTMAPQDLVFLKCRRNLGAGYRVYLLVPEGRVQLALRKAKLFELEDEMVVKSIESFVGQNIDELGNFSTDLLKQQLRKLIGIYNRRIQIERHAPELRIEEVSL
ncbi:MAG: DUF4928 family protein [Ktedonobacteraceae bacterium]|nr:DUF4928 family protein [Ktedonobacteraceae bacterium]